MNVSLLKDSKFSQRGSVPKRANSTVRNSSLTYSNSGTGAVRKNTRLNNEISREQHKLRVRLLCANTLTGVSLLGFWLIVKLLSPASHVYVFNGWYTITGPLNIDLVIINELDEPMFGYLTVIHLEVQNPMFVQIFQCKVFVIPASQHQICMCANKLFGAGQLVHISETLYWNI